MSDLLRQYMSLAGQELDDARFSAHSTFRGDPEFEFELAIEGVPRSLRERAREAFAKGLRLCESPIESRILPWLLCQQYNNFNYSPRVLLPGESEDLPPYTVAVIPQLPIGRRRVDFALAARRAGPIRFVVIECDGAEFHLDAEVDARRNITLFSYSRRVLAVHVITGKDIYKDAKGSARLASRALSDAWSTRNPSTAAKFA